MGGRRLTFLGGLCVSIVAAMTVALARGSASTHLIVVSDSACAPKWVAPRSGRTIFSVQNASPSTSYTVRLVDAGDGSVFGAVESIAPATTVPLDAVLPPGRYQFFCQAGSGYALNSQAEQVSGPRVPGAHPYTPVTANEIQGAVLAYRASLTPLMKRLAADTDRLASAVSTGRLVEARRLWLPAHLEYARLGVAYDTFGKFNDEIDGRPLGLVAGAHDPSFRGFLRLEYGLWHGQPRSELRPVATALDRAVHGLLTQFPSMPMASGDLALRAHEILENALQFELTGETDEGSHTNLATAWANVQGTSLAVGALKPVLGRSDPALFASVTAGIGRLATALASFERPDGSWLPLRSVTATAREQLDSATSGLLEKLERIPDELEPSDESEGGGDES